MNIAPVSSFNDWILPDRSDVKKVSGDKFKVVREVENLKCRDGISSAY